MAKKSKRQQPAGKKLVLIAYLIDSKQGFVENHDTSWGCFIDGNPRLLVAKLDAYLRGCIDCGITEYETTL